MPLVYACICPHESPPEGSRTAAALQRVADELAAFEAETVLLVTSRGPAQREAIGVLTAPRAGEREVDVELARAVLELAAGWNVRTTELRRWDAPLPYPTETPVSAKLAVVTTSWLEPRAHFDFGRAAGRAIADSERRVAIVCAAELSRGGDPAAGVFDKQYRRAIEEWDVKWLVGLDREFRRRAGEDAVAQTAVLMGALSGCRLQSRVLSCEPSAGGGRFVAAIDVLGRRMGAGAGRESGKETEHG
jgi:aromatic ring-opening dioxygenase LigB subunit